jgi:hypothetical protein
MGIPEKIFLGRDTFVAWSTFDGLFHFWRVGTILMGWSGYSKLKYFMDSLSLCKT